MSEAIGSKITRIYSNFRGADFRGEEINIVRSPDCLNVWKDYKETESIRTRPGMELFEPFDEPVYGVYFYKGSQLVHSGTSLYKLTGGVRTELYAGLREAISDGFIYENIFYFKDGSKYLRYDGNEIKEVEGSVPTTSIARKPSGGGKIYQDVNMLTPWRRNTFLADGSSKEFLLDSKNIDKVAPIVKVEDKVVNNYTVDYAEGKITFDAVVSAPLTDGQDNVSVEFSKKISGYREIIEKCTLLQVFDNRVFFSGNPDYPNVIYHCSLDDPSYCSDLDFYKEGMDEAQVRGLVAGNNALWVFREPSESNTNVFYHIPAQDDDYGKIYPSVHSSVAIGCVGKAINFNDDIVFFSERGMEGISGDITTEQAAAHRSTLVDRKLIAEPDYKNMILAEWEGYLFVFIGNKAYLADSRTAFTNEGHTEYEWFYWELEKKVTCAKVHNGVLYLGAENGIYTLTDLNCDVESYWVTPLDKFKYPHHQKTTSKRGSVAEATGDIDVYVKTEKTDFELIGENRNVTDYFVNRIKRKKWKDIQLKFHSKTRFSLETVTLEAFVGGFIKR